MVAVLWCVLGTALVALAVWGRRRSMNDGVRYRLALEPRRSIYVVEIAGRNLVVGSSEAGIQLLAELDADAMKRLPAPEPVTSLLSWKRA